MRKTPGILALTAVCAWAVTALPILGYSSATGFLLGGYVISGLENSLPGSSVSLDAYYGTAGVIKFQPSVTLVTQSGVLQASLESRKLLDKQWFGWGNGTDPDSSAGMDLEMYALKVEYSLPLSEVFFATAGAEGRFSTVFNIQESPVWDEMPGQVFDETFTAGLGGGLTAVFPHAGPGTLLLEARGFFQEGQVSYSGITGRTRYSLNPWHNGGIAAAGRLHRHFNAAETPVPYAPGIGSNVDFRGYSDHRFTGSYWTILQLEVSQKVLELKDEEGRTAISLSLAAFTEAGRAGESLEEVFQNGYHHDFGGGLRIGAGEQASMRFDAGWGDEGMVISTGFSSAL